MVINIHEMEDNLSCWEDGDGADFGAGEGAKKSHNMLLFNFPCL
jgi:hypothetical protein